MLSFADLILDTTNKNLEENRIILTEFFKEYNLPDYMINPLANGNDKECILEMFDNTTNVEERACDILENNCFCLEAFYVFYKLANDVTLSYFFNQMVNRAVEYDNLTEYQKNSLIFILNCYCDFLTSLHNYTQTLKVCDVLFRINGDEDGKVANRRAYCYSQLEDLDRLYDLYLNDLFRDPENYILLIIVCLKHEDQMKAKEVLSTLIDRFPKAEYIDHIWDLEGDNSMDGAVMRKAVTNCYDSICAIPFFFSWCEKNKSELLVA